MMSLTFGLFTQVSGSGPLGPLVYHLACTSLTKAYGYQFSYCQIDISLFHLYFACLLVIQDV